MKGIQMRLGITRWVRISIIEERSRSISLVPNWMPWPPANVYRLIKHAVIARGDRYTSFELWLWFT
jgi:hypothetical protein